MQNRVAIGHLQVQMRAGRVAAVSEQRQNISSMNMIVQPHLDASILQVRIGDVPISGNLQNNVVSSNVIKSDGRQNAWCIVRYSIYHFRDLSIRHGKDRFAPAPPILILRCAAVT